MVIRIKGKTMLVIAAGVGMLVTAYLTAKNTPEAQKRKEEALQAKREITQNENAELTWFESTKAQIGAYIPAIISGAMALGSLLGSEVINADNMNKAKKAISEYKDMSEKLNGHGATKVVEKAVEQKKLDETNKKPWNVKEIFRIEFLGKRIEFESTRADAMEALYQTNRIFQLKEVVTFNEFLQFLGQDKVDGGDERGWEAYLGDSIYGYTWIDFGLKQSDEEPWITDIYFSVQPHPFDEVQCYEEIESGRRLLPQSKNTETDDTPPWNE